jgi:hypothetical protein
MRLRPIVSASLGAYASVGNVNNDPTFLAIRTGYLEDLYFGNRPPDCGYIINAIQANNVAALGRSNVGLRLMKLRINHYTMLAAAQKWCSTAVQQAKSMFSGTKPVTNVNVYSVTPY